MILRVIFSLFTVINRFDIQENFYKVYESKNFFQIYVCSLEHNNLKKKFLNEPLVWRTEVESVTQVFKYIATGPSLNLKFVLIFTSTFVLTTDIHLPSTSFRNSRHDPRIVLLPPMYYNNSNNGDCNICNTQHQYCLQCITTFSQQK